mmetsp:Transcript_11101/g.68376  ORF Transcript_11101/g.68376 Transcript_11101/m.68376 type:complete len:303 (-) Transcript_11101:4203-5111(-)
MASVRAEPSHVSKVVGCHGGGVCRVGIRRAQRNRLLDRRGIRAVRRRRRGGAVHPGSDLCRGHGRAVQPRVLPRESPRDGAQRNRQKVWKRDVLGGSAGLVSHRRGGAGRSRRAQATDCVGQLLGVDPASADAPAVPSLPDGAAIAVQPQGALNAGDPVPKLLVRHALLQLQRCRVLLHRQEARLHIGHLGAARTCPLRLHEPRTAVHCFHLLGHEHLPDHRVWGLLSNQHRRAGVGGTLHVSGDPTHGLRANIVPPAGQNGQRGHETPRVLAERQAVLVHPSVGFPTQDHHDGSLEAAFQC